MSDHSGVSHYLASSGQRALYDGARSMQFIYASATTPIAAYSSSPAPLYTPGRPSSTAPLGFSSYSLAAQPRADEKAPLSLIAQRAIVRERELLELNLPHLQ